MDKKMNVKENDVRKFLDDVLNQNLTVEDFQEKAARSLETAQFEKVNSMLLEHYNKDRGVDFQAQLSAIVGNDVIEKLKNREDIKVEEDRQIDEQARDIEGVDKETLEKAKEDIKEEKQTEQTQEFDLRAELMKQVYKEVFKKYSDTLYDLKRRQIGKEELTVGDKEGTELVLYENYLKNLERNYNGYANLRGLDAKILSEDKDIKDMKENLCKDLGREEDLSKQRIIEHIKDVEKLYEERKVIAEKIEKMSESGNIDEFQLKEYEKEYRELTYQIRDMQPSLEEYARQIEIENKNIEFAGEYGLPGEDGRVIAGNIMNKDDLTGEKLEEIDESAENKVSNVQGQENFDKAKHIYTLSESIRTQINEGRFDDAQKLLEQAETELEIEDVEEKEANEEQSRMSNEDLDDKLNEENKENREDTAKGKIITDFDERKDWKSKILDGSQITQKDKLLERLDKVEGKFREKYPDWYNELKEQEVIKQR